MLISFCLGWRSIQKLWVPQNGNNFFPFLDIIKNLDDVISLVTAQKDYVPPKRGGGGGGGGGVKTKLILRQFNKFICPEALCYSRELDGEERRKGVRRGGGSGGSGGGGFGRGGGGGEE